jgi:hypothetical protein
MPRRLPLRFRGVFAVLAALLAALLPMAPTAAQPSCLPPEQARAHAGERACVEGVVTGAVFAQRSAGQPTFLDLGPQFTVVIWIEDRPKFNPPPETLRGRRVRVVGRIELYRGKAQIVVRDPDQLMLAGATAPTPPAPSIPAPAPTAPTPIPQPATVTPDTPPAVIPTEQARGRDAAPPSAATVPSAEGETGTEPRDGRSTTPLLAAGAGLLALGGGLAAWQRLRRRSSTD